MVESAPGNAAKIYCLDWIEATVRQRGPSEVRIVDLGCGPALNFLPMIRTHRNVTYVGVEPCRRDFKAAVRNTRGLRAEIIHGTAESVRLERADVVVSFSVLEHVIHRKDYLRSARDHLKDGGILLINYDAGHFEGKMHGVPKLIETMKSNVAKFRQMLGASYYYQHFVAESEFTSLVHDVGLEIVDSKMFNTDLKLLAKLVPDERRPRFARWWLETELALNNCFGVDYRDDMAHIFRTRNFVLKRVER